VSVEGTNATGNFNSGATWTLIADNVNLGIDTDPGRQTFGPVARFSNTTAYTSYRVIVRSQRGADTAVQYAEMNLVGAHDITADHAVVGRYVTYDGAAPTAGKAALRPGEAASFANHTNSSSGLTGLMVDLRGASDSFRVTPSVTDFTFETLGAAASWVPAASPAGMTVRPGAGVGGGDRVVFTWADGTAVRDNWLRVTVLSNASTGLARPDVFSFGNLAGDSVGAPIVDAADIAATRANLGRTSVAALSASDFNHDGRVNATDLAIARRNFGRSLPTFVAPAAIMFGERLISATPSRAVPSARRGLVGEPEVGLLV
jgi:hypothetical protein